MAKIESNFKNMVLTLLIICGVAALALGAIYNLTKKPIEKSKLLKQELLRLLNINLTMVKIL